MFYWEKRKLRQEMVGEMARERAELGLLCNIFFPADANNKKMAEK